MAATLTIKEGISTLELQERLGLLETHASAEATIQLEHHRAAQKRGVFLAQRLVRWQRLHLPDAHLRDHEVCTRSELEIIALERRDRRIAQSLLAHLCFEGWPLRRVWLAALRTHRREVGSHGCFCGNPSSAENLRA